MSMYWALHGRDGTDWWQWRDPQEKSVLEDDARNQTDGADLLPGLSKDLIWREDTVSGPMS